MAFWKKSEDPWDIDPEKKRRKAESWLEVQESMEEEVPKKSLLSGLLKKKETPVEAERPVPCPYCGEAMKKGYLKGGRDRVYWSETKPGFFSAFDEAWLISDEGGLLTTAYRTSYMCEACRKLVVDVPEAAADMNYTWKNGQPVPPAEQEEAEEDDL